MILDPIHVTPVGEQRWKLLRDVRYQTDDGEDHRVPAGFIFDGGSINGLARPARMFVCPMDALALAGFLLHDWYYDRSRQGIRPYSRRQVDRYMLELHRKEGVDELEAIAIYKAVRRFAAWSWMTLGEKAERQEYDEDFLDQ